MQYAEGSLGRVFILRLEEGDLLNDSIEKFARKQKIVQGLAFFLGGSGGGSKVVVGPELGRETIIPLIYAPKGPQEVLAVGTLAPNEAGEPVLHMHAAAGREGKATVGCTRAGLEVWLVGEVVLLEILGAAGAQRRKDPETGFELLGISK